MHETPLSRQLGNLRAWQRSQLRLLEQLQPWLQQQGLITSEATNAIEQAIQALQDDRLTVAVAGEFSRGKTELLNALFFADRGCRLLPTDAGRTTMCPTEIFYDRAEQPQLRLLPIGSRLEEHSLATLRNDPGHWQVFPLKLDDSASIADTLSKLTEHQQVPRNVAAELGLLDNALDPSQASISIPRWRLAQLNIPHPLLAKGLRILDTPGLNAIGSEPELTYEMLPAAHSVMFVLGADTGVTRSDMEVWRRFIQRPNQHKRSGLMVVLNKTDTLWDDLRSARQVAESILSQCRDVATTLDVSDRQVFAVSAQKALLARVQSDSMLEKRSGIGGLERHLGGAMLDSRIQLVQNEHTRLVMQAIDALDNIIGNRLAHNEQQKDNLIDLAGRSDVAVKEMLQVTQADFDRYQGNVHTYKKQLLGFRRHARELLSALNTATLEFTLDGIHQDMTGAWTTIGLRDAMKSLFDEVNSRMETAARQTQTMRKLLRSTHRYFEKEHHFKVPHPSMFSIVRHQVELSLLEQEAEMFRNSPRTTLMEQRFVTRRYFNTIVARVRNIVGLAHDDANRWSSTVLSPLTAKVMGYRDMLAQQISDLQATAESRKTIQRRIVAIRRDNARLKAQMASLGKVRQMLANPLRSPSARASGQN